MCDCTLGGCWALTYSQHCPALSTSETFQTVAKIYFDYQKKFTPRESWPSVIVYYILDVVTMITEVTKDVSEQYIYYINILIYYIYVLYTLCNHKGHSGHNKDMLQSNLKSETSFVPPPGACQFQLLVFEYLYLYLYLYLCICILEQWNSSCSSSRCSLVRTTSPLEFWWHGQPLRCHPSGDHFWTHHHHHQGL